MSLRRLGLLLTLLALGCDPGGATRTSSASQSASGTQASATSAGGGVATTGTGTSAGTTSTNGEGGAGGTPSESCGTELAEAGLVDIPASHAAIRYVGRWDFADPEAPRLAFPAVGVETIFEGDAIDLRLGELASGGATTTAYYDVSIDGGPPTKLMTCPAQEVYPLGRDLGEGPHHLRISKRTEAQVGSAQFLGFRVREGSELSLPEAPLRRLEFVGDSITCGYGNEVSTTDPDSFPFTSTNENALLAYGARTSSALAADYVAVAASGRGMVRNYAGGAGLTAPAFYDLTGPDAVWPAWDHQRYSPDVIVVNLGTNDFSAGLTPEALATMRADYRQTYSDFLTRLRELHALTTLIAVVGPMISDSYPAGYQAWTSIRADVKGVVDSLAQAGDTNVHYFQLAPQTSPYGEDWHPTAATQQRMADELVSFIRGLKGW